MRSLLLAALLALSALPARAFWLSAQGAAGGRDFSSGRLDFGSSRSEGWGWQGAAGLYGLGGSGAVPWLSARASLLRKDNDLGLKARLWPGHGGSSALGLGLYSDTLTLADEDMQTRLYWGLGALHQSLPLFFKDGSSKTAGLSQFTLDGTVTQSLWGIFQLSAGAGWFLYDRSLASLASQGSLYDQGQTLALSALRPVTGLPRWTLSAQAARRASPGVDTVFYFSYSRIQYAGDLGRADSFQLGMDLTLGPSLHAVPAYGLFIPSPGPTGHDASILIRWSL